MPDRWDEDGNPYVDFSESKRFKQNKRTGFTEYEGHDLASGYPADMIWTTKDGRRIAVPNMSDGHLLNTIAFLRRRVQTYKKQIAVKFLMNVTVANMMFDHISDEELENYSDDAMKKIRQMADMDDDTFLRKVFPIYRKMYQEAYKRKILIEVDASKLSNMSPGTPTERLKAKDPKQSQRPTEIGRRYKKPIDPIEEMAQAARDMDGIEVHRDDWELAETVVTRYPNEFQLGPARGPDKAWKRLELVETIREAEALDMSADEWEMRQRHIEDEGDHG